MNGLQLLPNMITLAETATDLADQSKILAFDGQTAIEVIIHMATVLILFFVLAKLLFNPVREILRKRREDIANEFKNIEEKQTSVNALKAEYEEKLANINKEATEILENARKLALHQESKLLKEAKEEAENIKAVAYVEIQREKDAAKDNMRKEIIEVATLMASKFVEASIDDGTKTALLNSTLDEMGENTWLN